MSELMLALALVLVPAALFLCIRPVGRLVFFVIGLVACAVLNASLGVTGLHGEGIVFVLLPLTISLAAALAEAASRAWRFVRGMRRAPQPD